MNTDFSEFEEKLGYVFKDKSLLETAFTHTTYVFEQGGGHWESNQRLEFIGDAVGDLVVGRMLYEMNPTADEGYLSKMRSISVCERSFAEAARKLDMEAREVITRNLSETVRKAVDGEIFLDYKSRLLELAQMRGNSHAIRFETVAERGPAHMREFDVVVYADDIKLAAATGHSKKDAEQKCAAEAVRIYREKFPEGSQES